MFKVSFSDGLALAGIVAAIVLLVLDKAGKLKGPALLMLLAGAAVMTLPLAFSASWVADSPPGMSRFPRAMLMFFVVGLLYSLVAVWVSGSAEDHAAGVKEEGQTPPASGTVTVKATLRELFDSDFPTMMKARRAYPFTDKRTHKEIAITRQLYLDNGEKEEFVGFFIPSSGQQSRETKDACSFLASHYEIALELEQEILGTVNPKQSRDVLSPAELAFKGRVYIYHEDSLSVQERVQIEKQFRSHGASVVLRGPAYPVMVAAANQPISALIAPDPADRPRLVFDKWGQIPAIHPVARQIALNVVGVPHPVPVFLQNGFYLINDGSPAYDVMVEPFKFGAFEAESALVPRIGKEGGFVLVWVTEAHAMQSTQSPGMWDLEKWIALAAVHARPTGSMYRQDYAVKVKVTYRDGSDGDARIWYRSSATLTYIPSQHRLEFRDIAHEKGSLTRPS